MTRVAAARPRRLPAHRAVSLRLRRNRTVLVALAFTGGCINVFTKVAVRDVPRREATVVRSPVKAHLVDGSTVLYPRGVVVGHAALSGEGDRYTLQSTAPVRVATVALDSVVGMETYETEVRTAPTVLVSTVATVGGIVGSVALLKAAFGSCPTFYSDSAGTAVLEAEGFSYSIAPLFEQRDVDRLRVRADAAGWVRLEVRNEALETHYLNQLELLEVRHAPDEFVLPDEHGPPLAVRGLAAPIAASDRAGRDVGAVLRAADGVVFGTDTRTLARAHVGDLEDYIDLVAPAPAADSAALVLRLRNSLLNTVLLYEGILGTGARALDWLGHDVGRISSAIDLGRWYTERMGLRVAVRESGGFRTVARVSDTGPIAFHDVAVVVPVPAEARRDGVLHLRLAFTADNWRIDRVAVAAAYRRPSVRTIPLTEARRDDGTLDADALASLRAPDESYLVTSPSQRFAVGFVVGADSLASASAHPARTFLLASQGYYTEWIRGAWIKSATAAPAFTPSDTALADVLRRWRLTQPTLERQFYASRIPVR